MLSYTCLCSSCVVQVRSGCVTGVQPSRAMKSQHSPENAARERSRVRNLRQAFHSLQAALPSVPRDTKLSKLDVLVLATDYIAHLTETLDQGGALSELKVPPRAGGYLHPVKVGDIKLPGCLSFSFFGYHSLITLICPDVQLKSGMNYSVTAL